MSPRTLSIVGPRVPHHRLWIKNVPAYPWHSAWEGVCSQDVLSTGVTVMRYKVASRVRGLSDEAFREAFGTKEQCRAALGPAALRAPLSWPRSLPPMSATMSAAMIGSSLPPLAALPAHRWHPCGSLPARPRHRPLPLHGPMISSRSHPSR